MNSLTILMKYFRKENKLLRVLGGLVTTFIWWIIILGQLNYYNYIHAFTLKENPHTQTKKNDKINYKFKKQKGIMTILTRL